MPKLSYTFSFRPIHLVLAVLLLLLLGTLTLSWVLWQQAETYYFDLNAVRLSPQGLHVFEQDPPPQRKPNAQLVLLYGDSRARHWKIADRESLQFVNRGIGAQTSVQVWQRYNAHVAPIQPDVLVLQVGINDLKTIGLFPAQRDKIVADTKMHISHIVTEATAEETAVVVTTIFPVGEVPVYRRPYWSAEIERAVLEVNTFIRSLEGDNVVVLDAYALLVDENGRLHPDYATDTLHVTSSGYDKLNEALLALLQATP